MKIKTILTAFLALTFAWQGNAQLLKKVVGNDNYVTREYKVSDFSKMTVTQPFNVVYKVNPDSAGCVSIYAEENIQELIGIKSEKGELTLRLSGMRAPEFGVILIHLYSSELKEVRNEAAATVELQSLIDQPEIKLTVVGSGQIKAPRTSSGVLNLNVSGGGDIFVGGKTGMGDYTIQGSGEIRALDVDATEVNTKITGSGTVKCQAEKLLKTFLTGSGKVLYKGEPELRTRTIGTGQVEAITE
jgi:hypothetical protein